MYARLLIHHSAAGLWGILLMACQSEIDAATEPAVEPAVIKAAVVGGKEVSVCQFPSTVRVEDCTGTLIHPRIITTAAHCVTDGSETIRFGGGRNDPASFTLETECTVGARGQSGVGSNRDWAYCMLPEDERVKQLPITPPLVGCEAERFLKEGATGWIVGYGTTGPSGQGSGVKRAVEVKINRVGNGTIDVGDREVGACHGDSGGPIYMQLTDGTNDYGLRVFGSTSGPGANFCDCSCSTLYVDIAMHIAEIEKNEGIDVTPCTDAQGNWAPGPDCNALQTKAMDGSGTFPSCSVARTTAPINSCGQGPAPAAGSGGSTSATAGSGAVPSAGSSAAGAMAGTAGASGAIPTVAADSGAAGAAVSAIGAAGRAAPSTGASAASAVAGMVAAGTRATGTPATGTITQGLETAGTLGAAGAPATVPADEPVGCGCAATGSPSADTQNALLTALFGVFLASRNRRRSRTGEETNHENGARSIYAQCAHRI